ncbi:MAG: dUTPase [Nitrososphaeria archaeon]
MPKGQTLLKIYQIAMEKDVDEKTGIKREDSYDRWFDIVDKLEMESLPKDKLELLFFLQKKLQDFYTQKRPEWYASESSLKKAIAKTVAMLVESAEALNELPWKPWKNFHFDRNAVLEEFVDVLHFWLDALLELGYTAEEVFEKYVEKCHKNMVRQLVDEKYRSAK